MLSCATDSRWEEMLETQPDYIKDLHRRLQQACHSATLHTIPEAAEQDGVTAGEAAAGSRPASRSLGSDDDGSPPATCSPPAALARGGPGFAPPAAGRQAWALPPQGSADEGAGCGGIKRFCSVDERRLPSVAMAAFAGLPSPAAPSDIAAAASPPFPDAPARVEEVAKEVLRLRLLKRQNDELHDQLSRAEGQLKRLSPHAVLQFHSYLERNLGDPSLAINVQESIVKLLKCLCAVCSIDADAQTPEALLSGVRMLLRDPHNFASKFCNMPRVSSEEAQGLVPFLLSNSQYKRVKEKEVNACYDALHAWLSAFHFYSAVSDDVTTVTQELERQESLLRRLNGQGDELSRGRSAPPLPSSTSDRRLYEHSRAGGSLAAGSLIGGRGVCLAGPASPPGRDPQADFGGPLVRPAARSPDPPQGRDALGLNARTPGAFRGPASPGAGAGSAEKPVPTLARMHSAQLSPDLSRPRTGRVGRASLPGSGGRGSLPSATSPSVHRRSTAPVGQQRPEGAARCSVALGVTRTVSAMPPASLASRE